MGASCPRSRSVLFQTQGMFQTQRAAFFLLPSRNQDKELEHFLQLSAAGPVLQTMLQERPLIFYRCRYLCLQKLQHLKRAPPLPLKLRSSSSIFTLLPFFRALTLSLDPVSIRTSNMSVTIRRWIKLGENK